MTCLRGYTAGETGSKIWARCQKSQKTRKPLIFFKHLERTTKIVAHRPRAPRSSAPLALASRCLALCKFRAAPLRSSLQPQITILIWIAFAGIRYGMGANQHYSFCFYRFTQRPLPFCPESRSDLHLFKTSVAIEWHRRQLRFDSTT